MHDWDKEVDRLSGLITNVRACMDVAAPNQQQALTIDLIHYNDELQNAQQKAAEAAFPPLRPRIETSGVTETETVRCIFAARTRLRS